VSHKGHNAAIRFRNGRFVHHQVGTVLVLIASLIGGADADVACTLSRNRKASCVNNYTNLVSNRVEICLGKFVVGRWSDNNVLRRALMIALVPHDCVFELLARGVTFPERNLEPLVVCWNS